MSDFTGDPDYYIQVGNDLLAQKRSEEAIRAFEQALLLDPASAYVHYMVAEPLYEVGRVQEALLHYQEVARLDPDDAKENANDTEKPDTKPAPKKDDPD